jgi:site-specific DNA recombinase
LGQRKVALEEILGASAEPSGPVMFHTRVAQIYRHKVENLLSAYTNEASRTEAQEVIRGLIERIVLTPVDGALQVEMTGELAAMLLISQPTRQKKSSGADASEVRQVKMVAGTGFEPVTFRL